MKSSRNLIIRRSHHFFLLDLSVIMFYLFFRFLGLTNTQSNVIFKKLSKSMDHNRFFFFICINVTVNFLKCSCFVSLIWNFFCRLSFKYHPHVNKEKGAKEKFDQICDGIVAYFHHALVSSYSII